VAELQIALLAAVHAALLLFQGYVVVLMVTTVHMIWVPLVGSWLCCAVVVCWQPELWIPWLFCGYVLTLTVRLSCSYPVFACVV